MFLYYLYKDELDSRLDAELAASVLHIGQYYGAPRLVGLSASGLLAREIKSGDPEDEGGIFSIMCVEAAASSILLLSPWSPLPGLPRPAYMSGTPLWLPTGEHQVPLHYVHSPLTETQFQSNFDSSACFHT